MLGKPSQRYSRVATRSVWSRGANPAVLVCIACKAMCGYDRCVAPSAQSGYSAILKGE